MKLYFISSREEAETHSVELKKKKEVNLEQVLTPILENRVGISPQLSEISAQVRTLSMTAWVLEMGAEREKTHSDVL